MANHLRKSCCFSLDQHFSLQQKAQKYYPVDTYSVTTTNYCIAVKPCSWHFWITICRPRASTKETLSVLGSLATSGRSKTGGYLHSDQGEALSKLKVNLNSSRMMTISIPAPTSVDSAQLQEKSDI